MTFTKGIIINQQGDRRAMVVEEANAIGTAWLRAGFPDESDMSTSRALLREYTEVRLEAAADPTQLPAVVTRSEETHGELWAIVEDNVNQGNESNIMGLVNRSSCLRAGAK